MVEYENYKRCTQIFGESFPSHWEIKPIYGIAHEKKISNCTDLKLLSVYLDLGVIPFSQKVEKRTNVTSLDLSKYQRVDPGDFVLNNQQAWRGSVGVSRYTGIVSPAYIVLELDGGNNSDFMNYMLRSHTMVDQYVINSKSVGSIQRNIHWISIKRTYVPIPPRAEQDQIVRFLDWKVSEINKLIGIRRKEIQELEELKRSRIGSIIMGQFQTQKKKSDISWVDAIPLSWKEKSLIQYAYERCIKNDGMVEDNLLSLSYGKIIDKDINTTDGLLPASFESYQIVEPGDIILRLTDLQNDHKSLRTGLVTQRGIITSAYTCLETRGDILPEFLQLELHVADLCKVFYGMGGGVRQSIGFKDIKRMLIAIPPLSEQHRILDLIHGIDTPIDKQKEQYLNIINELEELKKVIISDAVTGKVDVRNVTIPEYEHVDDISDDDNEDGEEREETETDGEEA